MTLFIVGIAVFLGIHSLAIFAPGLRRGLIARIGEGGFKGLYSVVSLVGFLAIIWGYGDAKAATPVLYTPPTGLRHLVLLLMIPVFPLLLATYLPGRIKAAVKHPMLTAVKTWGLSHLLANGTLADVLLFGGFLAWAVIDRISLKRRGPAVAPTPGPIINDIIAVVVGLGLYVAFIMGIHQYLFGVAPIASMTR
ncbi:MAG: NnrU family protein [Myxococcota bacterium]